MDSLGNVIVVGTFQNIVNFGGSPLSSAGLDDVFVAKFDPDGNHLWSKRFGDANAQTVSAVAIDPSGHIVFGGNFDGTLNFGGQNLTNADGGDDIFLAKLSSSGTHVWSKSFVQTGANGSLTDIVVDASGGIIITGSVGEDVDFGGGALPAVAGNEAYIAKFAGGGNHTWGKIVTGLGTQLGSVLAVLSNGGVVWAGYFENSISLAGQTLTANGQDIFLAGVSATGAYMWRTRFGDDFAAAASLALDADNRILLSGSFRASIDFGGGSLNAAGDTDGFVAVFTSTGVHEWSMSFGSAPGDIVREAAFDSAGNVVVVGETGGSVDLGGGTLVATGTYGDVFVGKLDSSGGHIWSRLFDGSDLAIVDGLGVRSDDSFVIGGLFFGTLNLGAESLVSAGLSDAYMAALGP